MQLLMSGTGKLCLHMRCVTFQLQLNFWSASGFQRVSFESGVNTRLLHVM